MSTIKLEIEVSAENAGHVMKFIGDIAYGGSTDVKNVKVVDAEEVKAPAPVKTPTPRPSRANPKPEPVIEEEEDPEFEEEEITADDLRALQATKIDKHRPAIAAHYQKLGAKGISSLAPENFQKMFDFLSKLK